MTLKRIEDLFRERPPGRLRFASAALLIGSLLWVGPATQAWQEARIEQIQTADISSAEFSRIIRDFSEAGGFFRSDNFVSNETSYLHVVDKLKQLGATGGAYIGVGPDQNFSYIAKIRPRIAFIVDIRRQAIIQHLMFKAVFHLAENRARFLSLLLCKPLEGENVPGPDTSIEQILETIGQTPGSEEMLLENLVRIRKMIETDFQFPLSAEDHTMLQYVVRTFHDESLNIQYRSGTGMWMGSLWSSFPTLRDLILERDLYGRRGNFLVEEDDYRFVRTMHLRNRIIPIVGNFGGEKALAAVSEYLKKNGYTVTVFYTSNVEQYLFTNGIFKEFVENVRGLPVHDKSLFIRAFPNMRDMHPARVSGHRLTTLLQWMTVFLKDCEEGNYADYLALVTTHYIAGDSP